MKYIATRIERGIVQACTAQDAEEFRHSEDFFVVRIDYDKRVAHWLTFEDEVPLND